MEDNGFDLNLKPCASRESAAVTESSSSQSTASPVGTEWGDQFTDRAIPAARFSAHQRVYAKDDVTGLLFMAVVRKSTWGPADTSSSAFCSSLVAANNANEADCEQQQPVEKDDDDNEGWSHHHFVHYLGWAVKWDRWIEEKYLFEDSESARLLAQTLTKEYQLVKPKKKGQKMTAPQVAKWMQRVYELEAEHRKLEKEGKLDTLRMKEDPKEDTNEKKRPDDAVVAATESKAKRAKKMNSEALEKQATLRTRSLQMKRKRSHSEKLHMPFGIKKVLVEEWEVVTQCGMVHDLPCRVTVRDALNHYFESKKVTPSRQNASDESEANEETRRAELEKEWNTMVEGVALFFDQALPVHLLFEEEREQYESLRRQIRHQNRMAALKIAEPGVEEAKEMDAPNNSITGGAVNEAKPLAAVVGKPLPERMSDIYGCEHLLRLFVRLPAVVAATSLTETESRQIFSRLGDLVRHLQKHHCDLFSSKFRKPLQSEVRRKKKSTPKRT